VFTRQIISLHYIVFILLDKQQIMSINSVFFFHAQYIHRCLFVETCGHYLGSLESNMYLDASLLVLITQ